MPAVLAKSEAMVTDGEKWRKSADSAVILLLKAQRRHSDGSWVVGSAADCLQQQQQRIKQQSISFSKSVNCMFLFSLVRFFPRKN